MIGNFQRRPYGATISSQTPDSYVVSGMPGGYAYRVRSNGKVEIASGPANVGYVYDQSNGIGAAIMAEIAATLKDQPVRTTPQAGSSNPKAVFSTIAEVAGALIPIVGSATSSIQIGGGTLADLYRKRERLNALGAQVQDPVRRSAIRGEVIGLDRQIAAYEAMMQQQTAGSAIPAAPKAGGAPTWLGPTLVGVAVLMGFAVITSRST